MDSPAGALSDKCIGGAPTRALSPRRYQASRLSPQTAGHAGRLFSQIVGQDKAFRAGKTKAYQSYVRFDRHAKADGLDAISGKSMIEMLAVLAIMGILAIGGIAAYSFAVSKHHANQIYNQVDLRAITAFSNPIMRQTLSGNTFFLPGFEDSFENLTYEQTKRERAAFEIKVSNVPRKVCKRLQDMTFKLPRQVTLNGEDISSTCGTQNTFVFIYDGLSVGKPSSGVDPIDCTCSGCQSCESGTCQDNDNLCGPKEVCVSGTCQCAPDYTECRGSCYTTCADGLIRDPISCDCVCEAQDCPDHAVWDNDTCACVCDTPLIYDQDSNSCKCPDENAPYYFEEANLCCKSGYTPVDGVCQKVDCRGGPTNYVCYINDILCGYECNALGRNCRIGICYADECATEEPFTFFNWPDYYYYCKRRFNDMDCYRYGTKGGYNGSYKCFKNEEYCMMVDAHFKQLYGTCDLADCTKIQPSASLVYWGDTITQYGSCDFGDNLLCYPVENKTKWTCYQNGFLCGDRCADSFNCGDCQKQYCLNGMTYNPETGYCEDPETGVYCETNIGAFTQDCFNKEGKRCASFFAQEEVPRAGSCTPNCPAGTSYGNIEGLNYYGCIQENSGISCYYDYFSAPAICYYQGKFCGAYCDFTGKNCQEINLPQCALAGHCPQTGYDMSDGCTCDGEVTTQNGVSYCCPAGHTYVNGACAVY